MEYVKPLRAKILLDNFVYVYITYFKVKLINCDQDIEAVFQKGGRKWSHVYIWPHRGLKCGSVVDGLEEDARVLEVVYRTEGWSLQFNGLDQSLMRSDGMCWW